MLLPRQIQTVIFEMGELLLDTERFYRTAIFKASAHQSRGVGCSDG